MTLLVAHWWRDTAALYTNTQSDDYVGSIMKWFAYVKTLKCLEYCAENFLHVFWISNAMVTTIAFIFELSWCNDFFGLFSLVFVNWPYLWPSWYDDPKAYAWNIWPTVSLSKVQLNLQITDLLAQRWI